MTGDNQPCPDWWQPQPGRHCGELCVDQVCPVCAMPVQPAPIVVEPVDDWPYNLIDTPGTN